MDNEFNWEDSETTEDFFSDVIKNGNEEPIIVDDEKDSKKDEVKKEKKKEEEEKEEDLFSTKEVENKQNESEVGEQEENTEIPTSILALNYLKDSGLVNFELKEGEELTADLAQSFIEDSYEEAIDEKIKEKMENLSDDKKYIFQFLLKGGSVADLLNEVKESSFIEEDLDLSDEANQEYIVRSLMEKEGEDDEFIDTQIELLKDSGKMKMFAEKKYEKYLKESSDSKKALFQKQESIRQKNKEDIRKAKNDISAILAKEKEIGGLEFSKEDRKILPSYISDRTVKLQNGGEISEMQKELFYEIPKNEKALIQLAILLRNRNEDGTFNFDDISAKIKTEYTKEIKKEIRRNKSVVPISSNKGYNKNRTLADYFN